MADHIRAALALASLLPATGRREATRRSPGISLSAPRRSACERSQPPTSGPSFTTAPPSVTYEPNPKANTAKTTVCKATVTFYPTQPPRQVLLRFRSPGKTPLRAVKINGAPAVPADAQRGDVDITGLKGTTTVEVEF